MLGFGTAAPTTTISRFVDLITRWNPGNHLGKRLADYYDDELDEILAATGKSRADLFTVFKGNTKHRQLLGKMMKHFGVNRRRATRHYWNALKMAEQTCSRCTNSTRCRSWLSWGSKNDAPRIFCPCAPLFDEIACANQNTLSAFPIADGKHRH
jgi:hypothetical protein